MELLDFINSHENWKELLQQSPFFLKIKESDGFVLLKYDQINSDFSLPIVQECRGIILNQHNRIVCWPFYKFFNYGEPNAHIIDWSGAKVQEKIDGSLMKLWYRGNGSWMLSTNGSIDAYETPLGGNELLNPSPYKTFGELFESATNFKDLDLSMLNPRYTYMFELTSPYNKVVCKYDETTITHIGTRDITTGQELDIDIGIKKPRMYNISTIDECIKCASELSNNEEGFVVVDKDYNRIKVKNPVYLQLHRMIGNNQIKFEDVLKLVLDNDQDEFLSYFPEYKDAFARVENGLKEIKDRINKTEEKLISYVSMPRKEYAQMVFELDKKNSAYYFKKLDDDTFSIDDYIRKTPINKVEMLIMDDKLVDK